MPMPSATEAIPPEVALFQRSSITRSSQRRTIGIMTSMVGKAIAQESIHETIQMSTMPGTTPRARQVAKPDTRKVMKKLVPSGRA